MSKGEKTYKEYYIYVHKSIAERIEQLREIGFIQREIFNYALMTALCSKPIEEVAKEILDFRIKQKDLLKEVL
ncbi:MAG: hypothetical protein QXT38_04585 [Candidatus Aenigmatarchaeota archaeon]